ncbi:DUF1643 domain-containing protein [Brevundimonas sp.]|uniref:DUF1643 domain-containing protein n=1 Tax=Brevundimonas sp. TaxID=1871086 RepID=UPI0028A91F71|nr:DUF1643 domain-containing protein [Brevundimonas sp.]
MSAVFSECGLYRYRLDRHLSDEGETLAAVLVNPSTADAARDDQTIRKVQGFARRAGFGHLIVGNLFAYRSTDIKGLAAVEDPRGGFDNNKHLEAMIVEADSVLFAWGASDKIPKKWRGCWTGVADIADRAGKQPLCLGVAKDGHPLHPMTLGYSRLWQPWKRPA